MLTALMLTMAAHGAEVTTLPDALTGGVGVLYSGSRSSGALEEGDEDVAKRAVSAHDLSIGLVFAPIKGLAITTDIDLSPGWSIQFTEARQMLLDPVDGTGSYLSGPSAADSEVSGSGLKGAWFGIAASPFSQTFAGNDRLNWRLDAAFRTANKNTRWAATEGSGRPV